MNWAREADSLVDSCTCILLGNDRLDSTLMELLWQQSTQKCAACNLKKP